ncbi:MAG TPA: HEAT repeat domain-containing protein [Planctomycetota bacterium]
MLMRLPLVVPVLFLASPPFSTWDEPWHEDVVRKAATFVKVKVLTNEEGRTATAKVLEHVCGTEVAGEITIEGYYLLTLRSRSAPDDELQIRLRKDNTYYLFLGKSERGDGWALPTPSAGWAWLDKGNVLGTYRHSYHLCRVPEALYRDSQKAIFQSLHGVAHDDAAMQKLMRNWLEKPPARRKDDNQTAYETFFCQHAALECFYYFGKAAEVALLEPFLGDEDSHAQISAARALSRIDTKEVRERLFSFLTGNGDSFAKVMAVWGMRRLGAREYQERLAKFAATAPTEKTGFGGGIMDPRVGTSFPASVKAAVEELLDEWKKTKSDDGKR